MQEIKVVAPAKVIEPQTSGSDHKKEKKPKPKLEYQPRKDPDQDPDKHKKSSQREHIAGLLEDPHTQGVEGQNEFALNMDSRKTFENVVFQEFKTVSELMKAAEADATLKPICEKLKTLGTVPGATEIAQICTMTGLDSAQVLFWSDFHMSARSRGVLTLSKPQDIMVQCAAYLKDDDHLTGAVQIGIRQLKAYQEAADADISEAWLGRLGGKVLKASKPVYSHDVYAIDQQTGAAFPVQATDLRTRSGFQRFLQIHIPFGTEAHQRRAAYVREKEVKRQEELAQEKDVYGGVRFVRKGRLGKRLEVGKNEVIRLQPRGKYADQLVRSTTRIFGINEVDLRTIHDKNVYEKIMLDIVNARVDYYKKTTDPSLRISPRCYETKFDNAGRLVATLSKQAEILDIERFGTATDPEARFKQQAHKIQEDNLSRTVSEIAKKRAEQKKDAERKALDADVKVWKEQLGEKSDAEKASEEQKKADLGIEKAELEKAKAALERRKQEGDRKQTADTSRARIITERGLAIDGSEIVSYRSNIQDIASKQAEIDRLISEQQSINEQIDRLTEPRFVLTTETTVGTKTVKESKYRFETEITQLMQKLKGSGGSKGIEERIQDAVQEKATLETKNNTLIQNHKDKSLTHEIMLEAVHALDESIDAQVRIDAFDNTGGEKEQIEKSLQKLKLSLPADPEEAQKMIEAKAAEIGAVGTERIQQRQIEMLDTYAEMWTGIDAQDGRLQQHILGTLADVPNVAEFAGYPRMYLRTLQILFGDDVIKIGEGNTLSKYAKLIPPEELIVLLNGPPQLLSGASINGIYDPRLRDTTQADFITMEEQYTAITEDFLGKIRTSLDGKVRTRTLGDGIIGGTISEKDVFLKNMELKDSTYVIDSVLRSTYNKHLYENTNPVVFATFQVNAKSFWYHENDFDLARRLIEINFPSGANKNQTQYMIFYAQEIIRYRKEHPQFY